MTLTLSIDKLLNDKAKQLKPGESITFTIVKGAVTSSSIEEVLKIKNSVENNNNNNGENNGSKNNSTTQQQSQSSSKTSKSSSKTKKNDTVLTFPRIAKFGESVVKPDFKNVLNSDNNAVCMYEQDIPKIKSESDNESDGDNNNTGARKKKKRFRRNEGPRRQWIIEPNNNKGSSNGDTDNSTNDHRYRGLPESNLSHYMLFSACRSNHDESSAAEAAGTSKVEAKGKSLSSLAAAPYIISVVPIHGFNSFSQPARGAALSMSEAEAAIENQRANLTRYIMHGKLKENDSAASSSSKNKKGSKTRLLGRLVSQDENDPDFEDNDVMGDVSFRNRKAATAKSRKELLSDLGDENASSSAKQSSGGGDSSNRRKKQRLEGNNDRSSSTGAGGAVEDDFYQRDVAAEYEDLDFDANEQFDDDDVDVTGDAVQFNAHTSNIDRSDDDDFDDDDQEDGAPPSPTQGVANNAGGAGGQSVGLGSAAGLRAMMAKARGENTDDANNSNNPNNAASGTIDAKGKKTTAYNRSDEPLKSLSATKSTDNHDTQSSAAPLSSLQQVMDAASKATIKAEKKTKNNNSTESTHPDHNGNLQDTTTTGVERDESGNRLITLQAIRREIWLHHGQIRMKRLMKIFSIKNDPQRYNKFRDLVKELCTMKVDKVEGNMLVLKQHWSNMG